eukprot:4390413-Prymnesium_polylepis.1
MTSTAHRRTYTEHIHPTPHTHQPVTHVRSALDGAPSDVPCCSRTWRTWRTWRIVGSPPPRGRLADKPQLNVGWWGLATRPVGGYMNPQGELHITYYLRAGKDKQSTASRT